MSITCREKLELDHPEFIDEKWNGGCKDCPSMYGYIDKMVDCMCDCKTCDNDICTKCWDQPYEGELTELEKKYVELKNTLKRNIAKMEDYSRLGEYIRVLYNDSLHVKRSHSYIPSYSGNHVDILLAKLVAVGHTLTSLNRDLTATRYDHDKMELSRNRWRTACIGLVVGMVIGIIVRLFIGG